MTLVQLYLPLSFALFQNAFFNDVAVACSNVKQHYTFLSTAKFPLLLLPSWAQPPVLGSFLIGNTGNTLFRDYFKETCWCSAPLGQDSEFPIESMPFLNLSNHNQLKKLICYQSKEFPEPHALHSDMLRQFNVTAFSLMSTATSHVKLLEMHKMSQRQKL